MEQRSSGTPELESRSIFYKVMLAKFLVLNSNLEAIFVEHLRLIRLADFGMLEQENA